MRIALAQFNPALGDLEGNATDILEAAGIAQEEDVDLLVLPPHALTGWPLEGLCEHLPFLEAVRRQLQELAEQAPVALLMAETTVQEFHGLDVAATEIFVLENSMANSLGCPELALPDESFGIDFGCDGISICLEDHFEGVVAEEGDTVLLEMCCDVFDDLEALPVARGQLERLQELARESGRYVAYLNLTGGQDSTVFAGGSCVLTPAGELIGSCSACRQEIISFDTKPLDAPEVLDAEALVQDELELIWNSAVMATRDYMNKNGFADAVIGLSGGIDSAVVAAIAADAIGGRYVHGVLMPSRYSSAGSVDDSLELARNLGIETVRIGIEEPVGAFHESLAAPCGGAVEGLAAENLQARVRAVYLMTLSNAHGWMVLNTGNKSEAAMGFSTLYGDTAGAFAPIGDLYKTQVYELARWRAAQGPSIPQACIDKAPSAELYEGARDEDRLPPYDLLDTVLAAHIEGGMGAADLKGEGFDPQLVGDVLKAVRRNEYKRRAEPIAPHFGGVALTEQRCWPITNKWCDRG
ncbi:MAG: NAD(+) synthase [Coriobacteriales bacterium]